LGAQLFSSVSPAASSRIRGLSVPDAQNYGPQRIEPKRHNLSEPGCLVFPERAGLLAAKRTGLRPGSSLMSVRGSHSLTCPPDWERTAQGPGGGGSHHSP
jgi:hypothetical protein